MLNEFSGRSLDGITVAGEDGNTSFFEISGESWLNNFTLPRAAWGTPTEIKIFDLCMLFVFALVYDLLGCYYIEHTREWYHNQIRRPQATVMKSFDMTTKIDKDDGDEEKEADDDAGIEEGKGEKWPQTLSVTNLTYSVHVKANQKCNAKALLNPCLAKLCGASVPAAEENSGKHMLTLLNGVDALFRRGRMCALMGTSGAVR